MGKIEWPDYISLSVFVRTPPLVAKDRGPLWLNTAIDPNAAADTDVWMAYALLGVSASAPHGFTTDWIDFAPGRGFSASEAGSYDAIRVYLWAGMLDPDAPGRDAICLHYRGWPIGFGRTRLFPRK
jgi:endo-1,4-beta-D-glucanase Y